MYFLGAVSGITGANNHQAGGFDIPPTTKALYLVPSASGTQFEFGVASGPTNSTFQTTAARGAFLDGPNLISGPFKVVWNGQGHCVVGVFNSGAAAFSVRVYATV